MNPEALNGTVIGSCTVQQMIGRGGSGIVFRAQQIGLPQPVALKVLVPPATLSSEQHTLFSQRFCRDMPVVASLTHNNILPVQEYAERDGAAYLVMPYRSGGTLQDVLVKEGQLSWPDLVSYLDQMASAIDYAQARGVTHRNLKPGNVLLAAGGSLLVTDFGLINIVTEGLPPQELLLGASGPCVAPDYMAPEQALGEPVDGRADLYSLGVILYQMVTGKTPFPGTTAVYIAAQQVQLPPPSPRALRADLPLAAEQVILRAMAKKRTDRFAQAQDFANAFRAALSAAKIALPASQMPAMVKGANDNVPALEASNQPSTGAIPLWSKRLRSEQKIGVLRPAATLALASDTPTRGLFAPAMSSIPVTSPQRPTAKLANTAEILSTMTAEKRAMPEQNSPQVTSGTASITNTTQVLPELQPLPTSTSGMQSVLSSTLGPLSPFPQAGVTDALRITGEQGSTAPTIKLTDAMKIVQVPVVGQPGKYMTGFLPVVPSIGSDKPSASSKLSRNLLATLKSDPKKRVKVVGIAALLVVIIFSSFVALFIHARSSQRAQVNANHLVVTPNVTATAHAQATASVQANIILTDPLSENIHNWPIATSGSKEYFFSGGAYHILDNDNKQSAPSVLAGENIVGPMAYTLTLQEIKGNDASLNNSFGMIFRFTTYKKGNQTITTFYTFEVVNMKGGQYQLWKYDSSKANPWIPIWKHAFGSEFHWGHGPQSRNTFKVFASGKSFSFTVNDKAVGNEQDSSIAGGAIGMLVNLKGTEVAFSDLLLTHH
ncbi:MAG TPA: serine/threonine-protein kinase [Ktedonobacteraceae bacterium]|nr:serine/threonine-protein kinase [Ktedonobacteraceae bacterium]